MIGLAALAQGNLRVEFHLIYRWSDPSDVEYALGLENVKVR